MKENENTILKNEALFGGWISVAKMAYERDKLIKKKNLSQRFDDWMYRESGIKKQKIYNFKNISEFMSIVSKLLNCQVNMTCFVKNHEISMTYFENEEQIPWKHHFDCECHDCNSYFFKINVSPFEMEF